MREGGYVAEPPPPVSELEPPPSTDAPNALPQNQGSQPQKTRFWQEEPAGLRGHVTLLISFTTMSETINNENLKEVKIARVAVYSKKFGEKSPEDYINFSLKDSVPKFERNPNTLVYEKVDVFYYESFLSIVKKVLANKSDELGLILSLPVSTFFSAEDRQTMTIEEMELSLYAKLLVGAKLVLNIELHQATTPHPTTGVPLERDKYFKDIVDIEFTALNKKFIDKWLEKI